MASRAAKRVEVLPGYATAVQAIDGMAWQVRNRIVEANLERRPALGCDGDTPSTSDVVAACRHLPLVPVL